MTAVLLMVAAKPALCLFVGAVFLAVGAGVAWGWIDDGFDGPKDAPK